MHFANPGWLLLLLLMPLPWWLDRSRSRIMWPSLAGFPADRRVLTWRRMLRFLPTVLRSLAIGAMVVALARPRTVGGETRITGEGVAIVVALDQSSSMNTVDFPTQANTGRISRLNAAKATLSRFIEGRPHDLIGLVVFANYPDLAHAPILEHSRLMETVQAIRVARPGDDGTNIGYAIDWAVGALRDTSPSKKVLILLTDGNNEPAGPRPRDPEQAASLARDLGIVIHAIAIGASGGIHRNIDPQSELPILTELEGPNIELLEKIAKITGGRSFTATNSDALDEVLEQINGLEKSVIMNQILTRYEEHFAVWAVSAFCLLLMDRLMVLGWLRSLP